MKGCALSARRAVFLSATSGEEEEKAEASRFGEGAKAEAHRGKCQRSGLRLALVERRPVRDSAPGLTRVTSPPHKPLLELNAFRDCKARRAGLLGKMIHLEGGGLPLGAGYLAVSRVDVGLTDKPPARHRSLGFSRCRRVRMVRPRQVS
jgi:hypothetical protein